jgi:hypothetical protein
LNEQDDGDDIYKELAGILHSYVLSNWKDPKRRLKLLQSYIFRKKKLSLEIDQLNQYVIRMKSHIKHPKMMAKMKANLFTKNNKIRKYQFGSDFCPKCRSFKNYVKECSFCGYHEMTY